MSFKYALGAAVLLGTGEGKSLVKVVARQEFILNADGTPTRENNYTVSGVQANEDPDLQAPINGDVTESALDLWNDGQTMADEVKEAGPVTDAGQAAATDETN